MLIDGFIVTVALIIFFIVLGLLAGRIGLITGTGLAADPGLGAEVLANVIYFILYVGYFVYYWGLGQTPGMRVFGIYVGDAYRGNAIGFGRAALRYVGYVLSVLPCYIGLIWAAFDPRKQGWHDKIANTVVFRA